MCRIFDKSHDQCSDVRPDFAGLSRREVRQGQDHGTRILSDPAAAAAQRLLRARRRPHQAAQPRPFCAGGDRPLPLLHAHREHVRHLEHPARAPRGVSRARFYACTPAGHRLLHQQAHHLPQPLLRRPHVAPYPLQHALHQAQQVRLLYVQIAPQHISGYSPTNKHTG